MMRVAIRELKSGLSQILAQAQRGEVVEVTAHNKLVARFFGVSAGADTGLQALIGGGGLAWRGGKPDLASPLSLQEGAKSVSAMVLENRR